jgi:hypothetical protein
MNQEDAMLGLLQTELTSIQAGIRGLDTILFQIKGWCVTATLTLAGFAATGQHRGVLLFVGVGAVVGFWLLDCQFKSIQREFITKNLALARDLEQLGVMAVLNRTGGNAIGPAHLQPAPVGRPMKDTVVWHARTLWREARSPMTWSLYLFVLVCLGIEGLALAV